MHKLPSVQLLPLAFTGFEHTPVAGLHAAARSKRRIEWLVEALQSDEFDLRLSAIEEFSRTFGDHRLQGVTDG